MTFCSLTRHKTEKGTGTGSRAWIYQRLSALGLLILTPWFVYFLLSLVGDEHENILDCFKSLSTITGMLFFLTFSFYHGWLGIREVIEDYLHCPWGKGFIKYTLLFGLLFLYGLGALSLLRLFLG